MVAISHQPWMIQTALSDKYEDLVDYQNLFSTKYDLFVLGLVYGLLHDLISTDKPHANIVKINTISNPTAKDIIEMVYMLLDDGRDERDIKSDMLRIADGGVKALSAVYHDTGDLDISLLIKEAEQVWPMRIKKLHNI